MFGEKLTGFHDWAKIGYVPQKAGSAVIQFPITVAEMVALGLENGSWLEYQPAEDEERLKEALLAVGMENSINRRINELSGGQQQRVYIARALVSQPELLVLDEPTVGVDVNSQAQFYELLRDLNQNLKLTLILVSHDIDVVAHEVNQVACINRTLICHGPPKEVLAGNFMTKLYGRDLRRVVHGH